MTMIPQGWEALNLGMTGELVLLLPVKRDGSGVLQLLHTLYLPVHVDGLAITPFLRQMTRHT